METWVGQCASSDMMNDTNSPKPITTRCPAADLWRRFPSDVAVLTLADNGRIKFVRRAELSAELSIEVAQSSVVRHSIVGDLVRSNQYIEYLGITPSHIAPLEWDIPRTWSLPKPYGNSLHTRLST